MARDRDVTGAGERDVLGAGELGEREAALERLAVVAVALDDEHRAAHATAERLDLLLRRGDRLGSSIRSASTGAVEAVGDGVLDLLRRVRLREHLAEEELEEPALVARGCSGGCTSPSPAGRRARSLERLDARRRATGAAASAAARPGRARRCRARAPGAGRRSGSTARRRRCRSPRARRVSVDVASITARQSSAHQRSSHGPPGPGVGVAVAATVVDDDAVVASEVVHLRLPDARVADRVRRQQHDRRARRRRGPPSTGAARPPRSRSRARRARAPASRSP